MRKKIFYLAGFMASGKSTIGPILANTIGWNFYDLDKEVENREGKKIVTIFEDSGENYFRKIESEILHNLSTQTNLIVALGGGTLMIPQNREVIRKTGRLIFLRSSPEILYKRLVHKRNRPVLLTGISEEDKERILFQKIESLMSERIEYYEQAEFVFDTDKVSIGEVVDKIAQVITRVVKL